MGKVQVVKKCNHDATLCNDRVACGSLPIESKNNEVSFTSSFSPRQLSAAFLALKLMARKFMAGDVLLRKAMKPNNAPRNPSHYFSLTLWQTIHNIAHKTYNRNSLLEFIFLGSVLQAIACHFFVFCMNFS